jgi:hypothetical protein
VKRIAKLTETIGYQHNLEQKRIIACLERYFVFTFHNKLPSNIKICLGQPLVVRFEVITAVTMKNIVFWNIKTQFVLHRRHITSPLLSEAS